MEVDKFTLVSVCVLQVDVWSIGITSIELGEQLQQLCMYSNCFVVCLCARTASAPTVCV